MRHYTEKELADYAFDPPAYTEKAEVEAHVADCPECRERLAFIERIDGALREPIPWEISDDIRSETPPPPEALRSRARIMDEEAVVARVLLSPLLASPVRFRNACIEEDARFHTTGAVAALYRAAHELTERQPQFALMVVNAAVWIAMKLASARTLRTNLHLGRAYLERGRTLFHIGRYKDAEVSLDRAENIYEQEPEATGWDLAWVWLIRANIYVESERMRQGRLLALAAARQFRIFGDLVRYLNARLLIAMVLSEEGDHRASVEVSEEIIRITRERRDTLLLARALHNCAEAYLFLREFDKALPLYLEAYAIWDELGLEVERIRTNWSLATLDMETGKVENGIQRLDETYRAFEALGVVSDAALARMELGEALLRAGRPETVPDLLRNVAVNFASEGMMRNARIALAYLRDAIEQNRMSADLVRHVRTYIEQLPFQPTQPFVQAMGVRPDFHELVGGRQSFDEALDLGRAGRRRVGPPHREDSRHMRGSSGGSVGLASVDGISPLDPGRCVDVDARSLIRIEDHFIVQRVRGTDGYRAGVLRRHPRREVRATILRVVPGGEDPRHANIDGPGEGANRGRISVVRRHPVGSGGEVGDVQLADRAIAFWIASARFSIVFTHFWIASEHVRIASEHVWIASEHVRIA